MIEKTNELLWKLRNLIKNNLNLILINGLLMSKLIYLIQILGTKKTEKDAINPNQICKMCKAGKQGQENVWMIVSGSSSDIWLGITL